LANDNLVKFNSSLDNQKDSAGAAEKATKDLGGTVSAQITSIVNNIGNVARALDTVLGPALKSILQDLNNIISAASTAISKFTDLATGAVSRSAAALQAAASTGFSSKGAFIALKESIGTLRPELAQSEQDLTNLQGALDEAGRAAGRFSGKGDFGQLRNEVFDTITAMRQLIINRREALKSANKQQGGGENVVDTELLALRERIRQLLDQQNKSGSSPGSSKQKLDMSDAMLALQKQRLELLLEEDKLGLAIKENQIELLRISESSVNPNQRIFEILRANSTLALEKKDIDAAQLERYNDLKEAIQGLGTSVAEDWIKTQDELAAKSGEKLKTMYESIGKSITTGIVDSLTAAVEGTKSLADVAADTLRNVANILLQFGVNTALAGLGGGNPASIFTQIFGGGKASGGTVKGGTSYMVGERGPELFTPGRSGSIAPNSAIGGANVTVNVDASGSNVQGDQPDAKALGSAIGAAVQAELIKQKRPGGLLN